MRIMPYILTALALMTEPASAAQNSSDIEWDKVSTVIVHSNGLCNVDADSNSFNRYDPEYWKEKYKVNCWLPAFSDKSNYYIKVYDFNLTTSGILFSNEGWQGRPPVEVWVQGLHQNDPTVKYRRSLTLYRLTCWNGVGRYARLNFIAYNAYDVVVEQWENAKVPMRVAIPGSKEEAFALAVCK